MVESISIGVTPERSHPAFLAVPDQADPPFAGVVVIHDISGLGADIRRHCERFSKAGYVAIAPDLYRGGEVACVVQTLKAIQTGRGHPFVVIEAARRALAEREDVDGDRIGVAGFCMGGGFALIAAADHAYGVAGPFYGGVPRRASRLGGICPTIAQYGKKDLIFRSHAERLSRHLEELGVEHEVILYEEAGHSFMNQLVGPSKLVGRYSPIRAFYEPNTEEKAWAKLLEFFSRHLG